MYIVIKNSDSFVVLFSKFSQALQWKKKMNFDFWNFILWKMVKIFVCFTKVKLNKIKLLLKKKYSSFRNCFQVFHESQKSDLKMMKMIWKYIYLSTLSGCATHLLFERHMFGLVFISKVKLAKSITESN